MLVLNIPEPCTCSREIMEKGCPKGKSGVKYMIPGAKVKNHDVLAHEWFLSFMPHPNMSIKEERKRLDMPEYWAGLWEY